MGHVQIQHPSFRSLAANRNDLMFHYSLNMAIVSISEVILTRNLGLNILFHMLSMPLFDVCYGYHGVFVLGLCQNIPDFGNLFAKRKTQEKTVVKIGVARGLLRLAFLVICKRRHINTKVIACNGTKKHKEKK